MKKLFIAIFSLSILVLSGCNSKEEENTSGKEKITVWAMGEEAIKLNIMEKKFEEINPTYDVEIQAIPWDMVHTKVLTAITGGDTPDVAQIGTSLMAEYQWIGSFENLTQHLKTTNINPEKFIESTLPSNEFNGELFGIPWYTETRVFFYRKDLLNKVGYDSFPTTWEELMDLTAKLKVAGIRYPLTIPIKDPNTPAELYSFIWQNGTDVIDENKNILVTNDKFQEAISMYTGFFSRKEAPLEMGGELTQEFQQGNLGMFIGGPWMINILKNTTPEVMKNLGLATMPKKETKDSFVGGSNLVIFKDAKNKEGALKFIEFLSQEENQIEWFKLTNNLPVIKSAWKDEAINSDELLQVFKEQLNYAKSPKNIKETSKINAALGNKVEEIIFGKTDVEKGMKELEKELESIIKK